MTYSSQGGLAGAPTLETIEVQGGQVAIQRSAAAVRRSALAKPTRPSRETRGASPEQMEKLYEIVANSDFMDWEDSAEISRDSQADEWFEIAANGHGGAQ